ncbi:BTB/POZ domain-containing protein, partial [Aphis craccivora]
MAKKNGGLKEFQEYGGIRILRRLLQQVNPKITSLVLSILGDYSMNTECCEELLNYGILKDLSFIMKNINVDSIHYRIFRLIANLAKSETHIPTMYKHNIHSITIQILSNTDSDITKYTAIRALRKIWENSSKIGCSEMLKLQAVKIISDSLKSECKEIVMAVLRAQTAILYRVLELKHAKNSLDTVVQILGNSEQKSIDNICILMRLLPEQPLVSKIIYAMCKIRDALGYLHQSHLTLSMCLLLQCPLNRIRFVGIQDWQSLFLGLITSTNHTYIDIAINTLPHFQYCKVTIKKMVERGLIPMLIKLLSLYVKTNKMPHMCPLEMKAKSIDSSIFVSCASPTATYEHDASPIWTPPKDDNIATDSHSPYYSPVCESFDIESVNADDSKSDVSDFEEKDDEIVEHSSLDDAAVCKIIQFLTHVMYIEKVVLLMADKCVWETILDYMQYIENGHNNSNALKILEFITREVLNLNSILTDELILTTHRRLCRPIHELELCNYCMIRNKLGMRIIENAQSFSSKFGEGIMTGIMDEPDTPDTKLKLKILVSVHLSQTIDSTVIPLQNDQNPSFDDAIGALIALFDKVKITFKKSGIQYCETRDCHKSIVQKETTVTLKLDDGTLINTNKSLLSLKSPMFEAMFRSGGFKEAYQNTIRLNDVSSECIKSFLLLLEVYCDCLLPKNINVLLELITIADQYMLNELSEKLIMFMLNSISVDNCDVIYGWAKEFGHQLKLGANVDLDVIKYLFSSNSRFSDRVKTIKNISKSSYGQLFIEDLTTLIKGGLS